MDASRTQAPAHGHQFLSWVLSGALALIVAAAIVLALQSNTNEATVEPATTGRQVGAHVATAPFGTPDSFDEVRESMPTKDDGSVITPQAAQVRAMHQRR